ncbi:hypothetical protein [Plantactinospora sp. KBS50]|uniref:hypothetical protein n=1 Tax=Plantactinospora sp. KBS50 TaxID=2024580 RepID=UPI0012FD268B|nr:hypothetical protein [Plantactinospora sp. KBS50]
MLRATTVLFAVVLLAGCSGGSADPAAAPPARTTAANPIENSAAGGSNAAAESGDDVCTLAVAAFNGDAIDDLKKGEIDSAIAAYDNLAAHSPPEIAEDATVVRDGLASIRDALDDSGLDDEDIGAFLSGDANAISGLKADDLAALQRVGRDLTTFITSSDYVAAAQNLVNYYSEHCTR